MKQILRLAAVSLVLLVSCQKESTQDVGPKPARSKTQQGVPLDDYEVDPETKCPGGCGESYGYVPSFYSTEGLMDRGVFTNSNGAYNGPDNPNGYLLDVIVTHAGEAYDAAHSAPDGYTVMPMNFNYGAGGDIIYLAFTRNPSKVATYRNSISPITGIRGAEVAGYQAPDKVLQTEHVAQWQTRNCCFYQLDWDWANMNGGIIGAGNLGVLANHVPGGTPIEIGVMHSPDANANPPAGWTKVPYDFNKFVGGNCDFIYVCYKYR